MERFLQENAKQLEEKNRQIIIFITKIIQEKNDMSIIIRNQKQEQVELEREIERLTYKLELVKKNLKQRIVAEKNYERVITEMQNQYNSLVETTSNLMKAVQTETSQLEEMMDKTTSTNGGIESSMFYETMMKFLKNSPSE